MNCKNNSFAEGNKNVVRKLSSLSVACLLAVVIGGTALTGCGSNDSNYAPHGGGKPSNSEASVEADNDSSDDSSVSESTSAPVAETVPTLPPAENNNSDAGVEATMPPVQESAPSNEAPQTTKSIYWDNNGMFFIDYSLLGSEFAEICTKTNYNMSAPKEWTYWGNDLKMTEYKDPVMGVVVFMFQNDKCVMVYNDRACEYSDTLYNEIVSQYGTDKDAPIAEGNCIYNAYLELYSDTNTEYLRQSYTSNDMY